MCPPHRWHWIHEMWICRDCGEISAIMLLIPEVFGKQYNEHWKDHGSVGPKRRKS